MIHPYRHYLKRKQKSIEKKEWAQYDGRVALMFHEVSDETERWYDAKYSVSARSFYKLTEQLEQLGYEIVSPYEIMVKDNRKKVCLTFDDVFCSVYDNAFPYLTEKKLPFTIFPAVSLIGREEYISEEMLKDMVRYSETYAGAHSLSHCVLKAVSRESCRRELEGSKHALEQLTGRKIDIMAYPYGSLQEIGKRETEAAKEYYQYAFSTLQTCVTENADPYFIPRINVNEENYPAILKRIGERNKWNGK